MKSLLPKHARKKNAYCQTFENKSSPTENVGGLAPDGTEGSLVLETMEVVGPRGGGAAGVDTAALFQPPKSSSAVTLGAGGA